MMNVELYRRAGFFGYSVISVSPSSHHKKFECGTPFWVDVDFLSLCYLPVLREHVFYLDEVASVGFHGVMPSTD